jgi:hypothetical protein
MLLFEKFGQHRPGKKRSQHATQPSSPRRVDGTWCEEAICRSGQNVPLAQQRQALGKSPLRPSPDAYVLRVGQSVAIAVYETSFHATGKLIKQSVVAISAAHVLAAWTTAQTTATVDGVLYSLRGLARARSRGTFTTR